MSRTHVLVLAGAAALALTPQIGAAQAKKPTAAAAAGDVTRAMIQAQVKEVFDRADTNKDGFMSKAEFRVRMGAVLNRTPPGTPGAPSKEEAQRMLVAADAAFNAADSDGNGKLNRTESGRRALAGFDALDADHNGVLTAAEKRAARQQSAAAAAAASPASTRKLESGR